MNLALLVSVSRCSLQLFRYVIVSPKSLPFCFLSFFSIFLFSGVFLGCTALIWSLRANIHLLKSVYQDYMFTAKIIITVVFNQYWNRSYLFSNNCSLILEIKWFYCTFTWTENGIHIFTSVQIFASKSNWPNLNTKSSGPRSFTPFIVPAWWLRPKLVAKNFEKSQYFAHNACFATIEN